MRFLSQLLVFLVLISSAAVAEERPPNFMVIFVDDLG